MKESSPTDIAKRLRIIQGQLEGLAKMIDSEKECFDVLPQFKAVKSGLEKSLALYLQQEATSCMNVKTGSPKQKKMASLLLELSRM